MNLDSCKWDNFLFFKKPLRGKKGEAQESVRVTVEKKIEVFKDFISEVKTVNSGGFEEQTIFYRIERELIIAKALKKAAENSN
ncbi:MAG: hypothetical protein V4654_04540 [Bdellovibrionota bacterium]